jgi:hypothetical protein
MTCIASSRHPFKPFCSGFRNDFMEAVDKVNEQYLQEFLMQKQQVCNCVAIQSTWTGGLAFAQSWHVLRLQRAHSRLQGCTTTIRTDMRTCLTHALLLSPRMRKRSSGSAKSASETESFWRTSRSRKSSTCMRRVTRETPCSSQGMLCGRQGIRVLHAVRKVRLLLRHG